jgi:amino acid permease
MAVDAHFNAQSEKDVQTSQDLENQKSLDIRHGEIGGGHGHTQRRLRNYQVTMMGFCSGIGTGLFIGTGAAYAKAGPAGLLLAYLVVGSVLWCVMQSIGELATLV